MAVVLADIRARFPEFVPINGATDNDALISACLASAQAMTDYSAFSLSTLADEAVKYRTAQLLAKSPGGQNARLMMKDGSTIYDDVLKHVLRNASFGDRVP